MNLTPVIVAISLALGFGGAWSLRGHQIDKLKLEDANERISIQRAARATIERVTGQIATAQVAARKRDVRVRTDSDRTGNAAGGLRIASTAAVRTVTSDPAACNAVIAAYDSVATASSEFIQRVARDADQCHSDLQLIQESWPK